MCVCVVETGRERAQARERKREGMFMCTNMCVYVRACVHTRACTCGCKSKHCSIQLRCLLSVAMYSASEAHCNTLRHTARHCSTLRHTTAHCDTLQNTAIHCNTLQHSAKQCNTLQHAATRGNTLQHSRPTTSSQQALHKHRAEREHQFINPFDTERTL